MKALFLVLHRKERSPGQRYRHEQYLNFLARKDFEITLDPLLKTKEEDDAFYGTNILSKIFVGIKALLRRVRSVIRASQFDIIYIYRDAFFFGTFVEKWLKRKKMKIIYDFDDAIWLMDENPNQGIFNKLKNPDKVSKICQLANRVIVGNQYLASFARKYNNDIHIIPSTIDFNKYGASSYTIKKNICIGWTGSFSTIKHFETVIPALETLKAKYKDQVYFKVIGDPTYRYSKLDINGIKWESKTEVKDLSELDIGLMPLPDNEWTQGKCAMKGLQYMALGIPTIMSPVGVNSEIIKDGENGFLASTTEEWVEKISLLIENPPLRKRMGEAGRKTVEDNYSVDANKQKWLEAFQF